MNKIILHIDLNAFFVTCEEIKDPSLIGKPVAVGHEGRAGIVSTCSYTARGYGVSSGMPMFKAKKACPSLIVKEDDFPFYRAKSKEFFHLIKGYTKKIEMASIDECYADFTDVLKGVKNPIAFIRKMQEDLYQKTKLRCSIGVSPTKFLAKMASDMQKPNGLTILRRKDIEEKLYPLSIDKFFGIGKKSTPRFKAFGINTIGDAAKRILANDKEMIEFLGSGYEGFKACLFGYSSDIVRTESEEQKSIGVQSTLQRNSSDPSYIEREFRKVANELSYRAKRENKLGKTIQIVVKDTEFNNHNKSISCEKPTNDAKEIFEIAYELYSNSFADMEIRLVGIALQCLVDNKNANIQMSIFDYENYEEQNSTKLLINSLNRRLNKPLLKRASEVDKNEKK